VLTLTHIITLSSAPTSAMHSPPPPPPLPLPLLAAPPKSLPTQPPHILSVAILTHNNKKEKKEKQKQKKLKKNKEKKIKEKKRRKRPPPPKKEKKSIVYFRVWIYLFFIHHEIISFGMKMNAYLFV